MQLVDSDRDTATIWIARGAPRRWYAHLLMFSLYCKTINDTTRVSHSRMLTVGCATNSKYRRNTRLTTEGTKATPEQKEATEAPQAAACLV